MVHFTTPSLAKPPLKTNGGRATPGVTSLAVISNLYIILFRFIERQAIMVFELHVCPIWSVSSVVAFTNMV